MAKTKNQRVEARKRLFRQVIRAMSPVIKRYGREDVRLAMNYWNRIELEKKSLNAVIESSKKQLEEIMSL